MVEVNGQSLTVTAPQTGAWGKFEQVECGNVEIKQAGLLTIKVRPADPGKWKAVNLNQVRLSRDK